MLGIRMLRDQEWNFDLIAIHERLQHLLDLVDCKRANVGINGFKRGQIGRHPGNSEVKMVASHKVNFQPSAYY